MRHRRNRMQKNRDLLYPIKNPAKVLLQLRFGKKIGILAIVTIVVFLLGVILNCYWPFPCFARFVACLYAIGVVAFFAITLFEKKMQHITTTLASQAGARKANAIYFRYYVNSLSFFILPLLIVVIFGIGGCLMFGAISFSPTTIWVLFLFAITVYISIIGYLQYIALAIYIYNLAHSSEDYQSLPKDVGCIPAQIDWLQQLTKLMHAYRTYFFTLGSTYILAFGAFCWLPEMQANTNSPVFFILWGVIFVLIVILFPATSVCEYRWIRQIVEKLKDSYIKELNTEKAIASKAAFADQSIRSFLEMICATQIINSKDYPLKSSWATCYAVCLTVLNFVATLVTIVQGLSSISLTGIQQIF